MGTRTQIQIRGIVQGVGFRPYVYSLATRRALRGRVVNNESGVLIDVEGDDLAVNQFVEDLQLKPPPLSVIESIDVERLTGGISFRDFSIDSSVETGTKLVPVSADIATCEDCLREMFDPGDRRYRYPFINCTNCGPRFTIVERVPYDRANTTMRKFEMCSECRAEYEEPLNRRFHAEPTCCAKCGPAVALVATRGQGDVTTRQDPVKAAAMLLLNGKILAIKGLGGYHLACDAVNSGAVERLRKRKYREDKPFALMAASVEIVKKYCHVSNEEAALLISPNHPIVLLERRTGVEIPASVAPVVKTLGFMLPYTPLHHLLLENFAEPLVMTSGNVSDEPIAFDDNEAVKRLRGIADHFLTHDRRINVRTDDSVIRIFPDAEMRRRGDKEMPDSTLDAGTSLTYHRVSASRRPRVAIIRRSRGFAPAPIKTLFKFRKQILACGAELKNTFCLTRGDRAYISHHIGDLENLETLNSFSDGIEHFKRVFDLRPEVVAYDLHPEYLSTKYALAENEIAERIGVQHHHAHIASCLADNGAAGEVIGVAMDGLGFGTDGKLWGGEFFVADFKCAERVAHLDYIPMPGGAKAIREPWRMAATYLQRVFGEEVFKLDIPFINEIDHAKYVTVAAMIASGTNSPETSSMGRLFDAVSALLNLRKTVNYEGQAAIELEAIADAPIKENYEFVLAGGGVIKAENVIRHAVEDLLDGRSAGEVSAKFHSSVSELICNIAVRVREGRNLNRVALSGGVFQNMFLLADAVRKLRLLGFEVLTHSRVPANDGGISLGQASVANALLGDVCV